MSDRLDIVLFPKGVDTGIVAKEVELVEEDEDWVLYRAWFEKPSNLQPQVEGQSTIDEQIEETVTQTVQSVPDTSPTPEGVDYDEMPELPEAP